MLNKMQEKFKNSKLKIAKNFYIFMIVPLLVMLVGLILLCTINFNLGGDYTGYSTFKVYVNSDSKLENTVYDLDKKEDYDAVQNKIKTVFDENGLKILSYRTSNINIYQYGVAYGSAVEVTFQNHATEEDKILLENLDLREQLLVEFDYTDSDLAITSVDFIQGNNVYMYIVELLAGITLALAVAIIYMLIRKYKNSVYAPILLAAIDILFMLGLTIITRIPVNLTLGIAVILTFFISLVNSFTFINKQREDQKAGKYQSMGNSEIADRVAKDLSFKRLLVYVFAIIIAIVFTCVAVPDVRYVALTILVGLLTTLYTSNFILPALWSATYKKPNKQK